MQFYHRFSCATSSLLRINVDRCSCSSGVLCFHNAFVAASSFFVHTSCCCHLLLLFLPFRSCCCYPSSCLLLSIFCFVIYIHNFFHSASDILLAVVHNHFFIYTRVHLCAERWEDRSVSGDGSSWQWWRWKRRRLASGPTVTTEQPKANQRKALKICNTIFISQMRVHIAQRAQPSSMLNYERISMQSSDMPVFSLLVYIFFHSAEMHSGVCECVCVHFCRNSHLKFGEMRRFVSVHIESCTFALSSLFLRTLRLNIVAMKKRRKKNSTHRLIDIWLCTNSHIF